jgi:hypothetical protein
VNARDRAEIRDRRLDWTQPIAFGMCVAAAVYLFGLYAIAQGL